MVAKMLCEAIQNGRYDAVLQKLYGAAAISCQRARYLEAITAFEEIYGEGRNVELYSAPGRTEIGGNHTDHNRGLVMAASINLDIIAVVAKSKGNTARVTSKAFLKKDVVEFSSLQPQHEETGTSAAILRGVAAGICERGGVVGGFDAYTTSDVLKGSGLSSSAAFEVCMGAVMNGEFNEGRFSPVELGIIGQYSENVFYGKPSGLMDQLACAVGGAITIDFEDPQNPVVRKIPVDLSEYGFSLVITDTKADHADLTEDYASIPTEMKSVAAFFGKSVLREVEPDEFLRSIPQVRKQVGDRAVLRAIHFFEECRRVPILAKSLESGVFEAFLQSIIEGGHSSLEYNQNGYSLRDCRQQALPLALALSQQVLYGNGAWRLQGGGFAGTIQAFVPDDLLDDYIQALEHVFGKGACHLLFIRADGVTRVEP